MLKKRSQSNRKNPEKKVDRTRSKTSQIYITDTKDFSAVIEEVNGKKDLRILHRNWYDTQINKFKAGERVSLYVSSRRPKRSEAQNRLYWAYLKYIEEETGNTTDDLHSLFKGKFLSEGIFEVMGEKVRRVKSSTALSKGDFIEYLMKIEALTNIPVPATADYYELKS